MCICVFMHAWVQGRAGKVTQCEEDRWSPEDRNVVTSVL